MQQAEVASGEEARMLAPAPDVPRTASDWLGLPRKIDRYLADHFGLRSDLLQAHGLLRYAMKVPSDLSVIIGRDNWLFLNNDQTIEQSTGKLLRAAQVEAFADKAAHLRAHLATRGARLIVAVVPNGSTINRARLPAWAGEAPAVTEYDLMLRALAARGVDAVDLRAPLTAANATHPTYRRTDTHWNKLGALIGYNAVVRAVGKSDWAFDPVRAFKGFVPIAGGDLARLLAVGASVNDEEAEIDLGAYGPPPPEAVTLATQFESGGDLVERGHGPTVAVVGDSFTRGYWQDYFARRAGRYIWMHHELCGFRYSTLDEHAPELVVLAPAERQMFCASE